MNSSTCMSLIFRFEPFCDDLKSEKALDGAFSKFFGDRQTDEHDSITPLCACAPRGNNVRGIQYSRGYRIPSDTGYPRSFLPYVYTEVVVTSLATALYEKLHLKHGLFTFVPVLAAQIEEAGIKASPFIICPAS